MLYTGFATVKSGSTFPPSIEVYQVTMADTEMKPDLSQNATQDQSATQEEKPKIQVTVNFEGRSE
jgi:hypothetical protein